MFTIRLGLKEFEIEAKKNKGYLKNKDVVAYINKIKIFIFYIVVFIYV